jgi:D-xylose transport system permease protein
MATVRTPGTGNLAEPGENGQGPVAGLRSLWSYSVQRWRHGELGSLPVIVGLIIICAYFQTQQSTFLSARNLSNLVLQVGATGAVALGIVLVLLLGEIDLSVGSVAGLSSAILGALIVNTGWPWWLAIVITLLAGASIGAFQGAWFAVIGVPSFVVTLAGFLVWQGVQLRVLGPNGTINVFERHIAQIAQSYLPDYWGWILGIGCAAAYAAWKWAEQFRRRRAGLTAAPLAVTAVRTVAVAAVAVAAVVVLNSFRGVPTVGVILLGLVILFAFVTTSTKFGAYVFAVGGNAEAARRAGIDIRRIRILVFAIAGFMAGIGGIIFTSRLTAASTQTGTGTFLLEAIAAAVIGGTSLFGGRGSAWSALLGVLVIGAVSNGLDLMAQPPEVKYIVEGAILLAAVTIDAIARRSRQAAGR